MIGTELFHIRGGRCTVRSTPSGSPIQVAVDFKFGAKGSKVLWSDLRVSRDDKDPPPLPKATVKPSPKAKPTLDSSWVDARRAIIALRLGQVTNEVAKVISVGTEDIESIFDQRLSLATDQRPSVLVVEGAWGTGKTHALALLKGIAQEKKMVVANLVLDGVAITLSRPADLLRETIRSASIHYSDCSMDLLELAVSFCRDMRTERLTENGATLLGEALCSLPPEVADEPDFVESIGNYLAGDTSAAQLKRDLVEYVGTSRLPSMRAKNAGERPQHFVTLLAEWARLCRLDESGLVLILDEVDVELALARSATDRERRDALLRELGMLHTLEAPLVIVMAVAPGGEYMEEFESPTAYLADRLGDSCQIVTVPELTRKDLLKVADRVAELYQKAYPDTKLPKLTTLQKSAAELMGIQERSANGVIPRRFIRSFLEYLDVESIGAAA